MRSPNPTPTENGYYTNRSMSSPTAPTPQRATLAVIDAGVVFAGVVAVTIATEGFEAVGGAHPFSLGVIGGGCLLLALWWRNAYVVTRSIKWVASSSLIASTVGYVLLFMVGLSWWTETPPARSWLAVLGVTWIFSLGFIRWFVSRRLDDGRPIRVIVAGNTGDALAVRLALRADARTDYTVQGFVMDSLDDSVPNVVTQLALGSTSHLPHLVKKNDTELVVVCLGAMDAERFAPLVRELNVLGVDVALSTGLSQVALRRVNLGHVSGRPMVRITPAPKTMWHLWFKRVLDVAISATALVVLTPVMLLSWLAIRLSGGGAAIFKQQRVGLEGEHFTIFKFRTMVADAEKLQIDLTNDHGDGPVFKMDGDPRITKIGGLLRKTSLDELPQLINILRGDMSLVGPRPLPVHEVEAAPVSFLDRQAVKPGLTGQWQVSGRSDTGFKELDELDRWYVDNWSIGQDFEILARTLPAVLLARGAR